jgi:GNAT superfamily N-acetyltransferase
LLALSHHFAPGQFAGLPGIGSERIQEYYAEWIRRAAAGEFADRVLVLESGGSPAGFASYKLRPEVLRLTGRRVLGQSLGAVHPRASGGLLALVEEMQRRRQAEGYELIEFECYAQNRPVVRTLDRLGFVPGPERECFWWSA